MKTVSSPNTSADKAKAKEIVRRMLNDKKILNEHISNGGKLKDLASKGIKVARAI